jgi:hypothetical protein
MDWRVFIPAVFFRPPFFSSGSILEASEKDMVYLDNQGKGFYTDLLKEGSWPGITRSLS